MAFERVIFSNLIFREEYGRKALPFLKPDYFQDAVDKTMFDLIDTYVQKYNRFPTQETLLVDNEQKHGSNQSVHDGVRDQIKSLEYDPDTELGWLLDKTEKFCQEKAVYNGIMKSIQILDSKDEKHTKEAIPKILSDALAVSFDTSIGHSFLEDASARYDFYHRKEVRVPFSLEYFNAITKGGLPQKTLNVALAGCVHPSTAVRIRFRKPSQSL